ncbi:MAG TPA: hypothetical protein VN156_04335 [Pseudomonas sp.]|nr:hypothetical protein [Pseudomonas sp.]
MAIRLTRNKAGHTVTILTADGEEVSFQVPQKVMVHVASALVMCPTAHPKVNAAAHDAVMGLVCSSAKEKR